MANYADSVWNAAQYKIAELMQKPEFRHKPSAALGVFMKNTDFLVPASQREAATAQKNSDQQVVEINTINKQATSAISARAHNHTGSINDSTKTTVTYTIYGHKWKYSIKQADRNVFTLAGMMSKQLLSAVVDTHGTIETGLMANLNTNKSQVSETPIAGTGTWDSTDHIFEVDNADENIYFQRLTGFMKQNFYNGTFDVISNAYLAQKVDYILRQGDANQVNLAWQMLGMNHVLTTGLSNDAGYQGMSYIIPTGTVGVLQWNPSLNKSGFGNPFQTGGVYRTMPDPLGSGLVFSYHEYATAADNSSAAAETQDVDIECELTVDLGPVHAPMTTSNAHPAYKAGLKST